MTSNTKRFFVLLFLVLIPLLLFLVGVASWFRHQSDSRPALTSSNASGRSAVKLLISQSGMYELTAADLHEASAGLSNPDPARLGLFYQGREQPVWIEGQGKSLTLRFYGQSTASLYARENVYWLEASDSPSRSIEEQSSPPSPGVLMDQFMATVHAEQDLTYLPQVKEGEHWFWATLTAPQSVTVPVTLTAVAPGPGRIAVEMWAATSAPQSPNHHIRVWVNGRSVGEDQWDGQTRRTIRADVPEGVWVEGVNSVRIESPGDTGVAADITSVDWIEATQPRFLKAEADRLEFVGPGGQVQLTGFSGAVTVFDVTDPERVVRVQQQSGQAIFQAERDQRYVAVGPKGYRRPARLVRAVTSPDLRAPGLKADYIAIGPPDLLEPLEPLLRWRESQGLAAMSVPVEAIYDQFNFGLPEPEAIRSFIAYAVRAYRPAPQYVVLVGDATYDPKGYLSPPEANRVPTFLVSTLYGGETASDVMFAELNGDLKPAVAIGRIPAREPQQVKTLVSKTLAYEQKPPPGEWRHRVLAIADGQEASFRQEAQAFLDRLSPGYQSTLFSPPAGAADANQQVKRYVDEGYALVAYFGHGSVNQWGKDRILTAADSATLANGNRLPVVINMTCLTGLFTHPRATSLAETLLWQSEGGTVAALAPTSLTLANDQSFLSNALADALLNDPNVTLGQSFLRAQRQVPTQDQGARDVMQTFLLFGDPALRLVSSAP